MTKKGLEQQIITVFEIASELSRPICQAMIEFIFSTEISHNSDSADALSATLLGAVKTAVEEDQSTGLELLATLDNTLSNKVRLATTLIRMILANIDRFDNMRSMRSSLHRAS